MVDAYATTPELPAEVAKLLHDYRRELDYRAESAYWESKNARAIRYDRMGTAWELMAEALWAKADSIDAYIGPRRDPEDCPMTEEELGQWLHDDSRSSLVAADAQTVRVWAEANAERLLTRETARETV